MRLFYAGGFLFTSFLSHYSGELQMRYRQELEDSNNPIRHAIVEVADYFSALITHDADDEILKW